MKRFLISILILFNLSVFAQTKDEFEVISLSETQKFYLNSQTRISGTTRSHLFINLPPNTISWIYMLTTTKSSTPSTLNLMPQVLKLIPDMGLTTTLISALTYPTGESTINTYLIPQNQFSNFVNNKEFSYYPSASRKAFNSGAIKVDHPFNSGQYYIGLENTAAISGVNITIEVVALVKKNGSVSKNNLNQDNKTGLQTILETLQKSLNNPTTQTNNENSNLSGNNNISTNNNLQKKDDSLVKKRILASNTGNLGWYAYERGDINICIEQSKKSISIYPLFFAKANLALCYLIQGDGSLALDEYVSALDLLTNEVNQKKSLQGAIKDIEDAKNKHKLNPIADDILKLLRSKL